MLPSIQASVGCAPNDSCRVDKNVEHINRRGAATSVGDNVRNAILIVRKLAIRRADPDSAGRIGAEKMSAWHERSDLDALPHLAVLGAPQVDDVLKVIVS